MNRLDRAKKFNRLVKNQRTAIQSTIPNIISQSAVLAKNSADESRAIASNLALMTDILDVRDWEHNMTTNPGDMVYDPKHEYVYVYSGAEPMKHTNQTFYPGASGVYYWAVVPKTRNGIKIYPDIAGIIVAVKNGELWYDSDGITLYKWNGVDNKACNWYPGQAGVHQWEKQPE